MSDPIQLPSLESALGIEASTGGILELGGVDLNVEIGAEHMQPPLDVIIPTQQELFAVITGVGGSGGPSADGGGMDNSVRLQIENSSRMAAQQQLSMGA